MTAAQLRIPAMAFALIGLAGATTYRYIHARTSTPNANSAAKGKSPPKKKSAAIVEPTRNANKTAPPKLPDPRQYGFRGHIFYRLDRNNDFALSPDEIPLRYRESLQHADRNNDGRLDFQEFDSAIAALPTPDAMTTARSPLLTPPPPGQRLPVYVPFARSAGNVDWFSQKDKNGDRQLGLSEWTDGALPEFQRWDANGDGFITEEEVRRASSTKTQPPARAASP